MINEAEVKKLIKDILESMLISLDSIEVDVDPITQNKIFIIRTNDSGLLIGDKGETFNAFSHLVKRIAEKKFGDEQGFFIDVNDYRSGIAEKLKLKAKMLATRARDMRADVEMEPMSSYERLVVHGTLAGEPKIKTESLGEGRDRRVIIKYIEELESPTNKF
jgi:spoIIIJ-associated protein